MHRSVSLILVSGLFVGCSQPAGPGPAAPESANSTSTPAATATAISPATSSDLVAVVLGQPVKKSDCLSRSNGIGSVEVGFYSLVLRMLMEDFSKSQEMTLSEAEIDAFWTTLRAGAQRANPNPSQPIPEAIFDEAAVRAKLQQAQGRLAADDVPLLEKLTLQSQVLGLQRALELKSQAAMLAYEHLLPLRLEAALYKKYGGKVVARQISMHASGAYLRLAEEAQASGKLVFHDEALKQAFWKRLNDDLANTEVPPERVDFSLPVWLQGAAQLPPKSAANATPQSSQTASRNRVVAGDPGILAHFAGVWYTTGEQRASESSPGGGKFTVKEVTQPILKGRMILGHEQSAPDGRKSLWLMGWDPQRNVAPFWMFDSTGLLGGQWELTWDAATNTAMGHATDMPPGWTGRGTNRFPNPETNLVDYLIKDASGKVLFDLHSEKKRQSDELATTVMAEWSQSVREPDRLGELQVLDELVGTWDAVTVASPAEWTPQETKMASVVTRRWILNDRLLLDTSTHDNGEESLSLFGVDSQSHEYRTWWFNSEGHRNSSHGQWDPGTRTFSFRTNLDDGKFSRSTIRLISPDQHEWQFRVTDAAGKVYYDATIMTTRRPAVRVEMPTTSGSATSDRLGLEKPKTHGGFFAFAFAPDGRTVAGGTGVITSNGKVDGGGEVILWDAVTGKLVTTLGKHRASVTWAAFSHNGHVLATFSRDDGRVVVWNLASGKLPSSLTIPGKLVSSGGLFPCLFLSADGSRVVAASGEVTKNGEAEYMAKCDLRAWDAMTGRELWLLRDTDIRTATLSPDGKQILAFQAKMVDLDESSSGSAKTGISYRLADPQLLTIDVEKGTPGSALPISLEQQSPHVLLFVDQGRKVAGGDQQGLQLWELESGNQVGKVSWDRSRLPFSGLAFSPDGKTLIRTWSNFIERIDVETGKTVELRELKFPDMLFHVAFSADLKRLAGNMSGPVVMDMTKLSSPAVR